ncbi:choice-of-anchor M domain-containing protein [Kribbella italica]|uniref:Surface-anchored protein n=1 Tax=Kribbella italica TaxID=1540520 RepID=A0A7W9J8M9_9ACTN|nr:choice-of-anchor M domain-containing protein [Kribbella italica]MBB5837637.1 surface-anchored protein [Kribbella italica]
MRTSYRVALPAVAVLAFTGLAVPAQAAPCIVLDQGHVDVIGIAFEDGAFDLHVHDEENDVEYSPADVQLVAKPGSETTVPADPAFGFLGTPGAAVWVLPQVQDPELLWPGIGVEEIEAGVFASDSVKLDVVGVSGPAAVSIYTTDAFGAPTVLVDSGNGLPDRINTTAGDHLHANWAFEAPGTYKVKVRASGKLAATGQNVSSPITTYVFKVVAQ